MGRDRPFIANSSHRRTNPSGLGVFTQNLRFPGQYFDQESGLHFNWFRLYDAAIGRYTTPDPLGLGVGDMSLYAYANQKPLIYMDPYGLWVWGDPIDQAIVDAVTGFGDAFLIPELVRDAFDIDGGLSQCSTPYRVGKATGFILGSVPFALRGAVALGATRFGHALNHNRYLRVGPGRMPAVKGTNLPAGNAVPRVSIGPQIKGGPNNPHSDLRSRFPYAPPIGGLVECGCP